MMKPQNTDNRWEAELSKLFIKIAGYDNASSYDFDELKAFISQVEQQTREKYKGQTKRVWYSLGVEDGRKQILQEIKRKVEGMKGWKGTDLISKSDILNLLKEI